jgi:hypothetical protein
MQMIAVRVETSVERSLLKKLISDLHWARTLRETLCLV